MSRALPFPRERFHRFRPSLSKVFATLRGAVIQVLLLMLLRRARHGFATVQDTILSQFGCCCDEIVELKRLLNRDTLIGFKCSNCRYTEEHSPSSRRSGLA